MATAADASSFSPKTSWRDGGVKKVDLLVGHRVSAGTLLAQRGRRWHSQGELRGSCGPSAETRRPPGTADVGPACRATRLNPLQPHRRRSSLLKCGTGTCSIGVCAKNDRAAPAASGFRIPGTASGSVFVRHREGGSEFSAGGSRQRRRFEKRVGAGAGRNSRLVLEPQSL